MVSVRPSAGPLRKGGGGMSGPRPRNMKKLTASHATSTSPMMIRPLRGFILPRRQNSRSSCPMSQRILPGLLIARPQFRVRPQAAR